MRSLRFARFCGAILCTLLAGMILAPTALKAQDSSSMTGVVTDATDAAVPGAIVTLTNKTTGLHFTATTDKTGTYHFLNVPPGPGIRGNDQPMPASLAWTSVISTSPSATPAHRMRSCRQALQRRSMSPRPTRR